MDVASESSGERSQTRSPAFLQADDTTSLTSFPDLADNHDSPVAEEPSSPVPQTAIHKPLNGLLDEGPSMFDTPDDDGVQTLATAPPDVLARVIAHRGADSLVRRLSSLLAERDAHVAALTRLAEDYRIPADQIALAGSRARQTELRRISLAAAANEELLQDVDRRRSPSPPHSELSVASTSNYATIRGLTRLFGGTSRRRTSAQPASSAASVTSPGSSRSASQVATVRAPRPVSVDVRSVTSNDSGTWATALFGGGANKTNGTAKVNGTSKRRDSRQPREPVEMSTRHDRDTLPPTLLQRTHSSDPQESEWNKFLLKLSKAREASGAASEEVGGGGELLGAARWGTEGSLGKAKLDTLARLVAHGIPMTLRHAVWMELSGAAAAVQPDEYGAHLALAASTISATEIDAILKDVPRTLTSKYDFYAERGHDRLQRVLVAFVHKYPGLGYTQGLNMIAGYLLLAIPDESDAFWLLCHMVECFFPRDYFARSAALRAPLADNAVLRSYLRELQPRLAEHLDSLDIDPAHTVPLSWFLTAYASVLPETALLRIWDVWLCLPAHRSFLFPIALALLSLHSRSLLECGSQGEYYDYMTRVGADDNTTLDITALLRQAFAFRKKLDGLEVRRALEMSRLARHASTEALYKVSRGEDAAGHDSVVEAASPRARDDDDESGGEEGPVDPDQTPRLGGREGVVGA